MFTMIMTVVNILALCLVAIGFFISRYTIVDLETWNTIATFYNENHNDDGEVASGNIGFFWDYVSELEEQPDEEEDE